MRSHLRGRQWIELAGLALILIGTAWQLFIVDTLQDMEEQADYLILDEKIDTLWRFHGAQATIEDREALEEQYHRSGRYFEETETFAGRIRVQEEITGTIGALAFLAGTALMLVARYLEMSSPAGA